MQILKVFLKPVDERYRDEVNRMKAGKKVKAPYTEKINIHVPSGWYDTGQRKTRGSEKVSYLP